ncbi:MAG: hypothetical protein L0228_06070 [Planctomycetes bacterium]|nr:hypothetical protein [Planctomycetota bacterium]
MRLAKLPVALAFGVFVLSLTNSSPTWAVEVLVNGDLESSVSPPGWSLTTSITGIPGSSIPSLFEHNDGANNPPLAGLGLVFRPWAGNVGVYAGMNHKTNFVLEQTNTAIPGKTFTFKGDTLWGGDLTDDGYSGGVVTLDPMSPSGAIPSPTITKAEVAYLNSSNVVLGTPTMLDLRTVQMNDAMWRQFSMAIPLSPSGTAKVRVRVTATDMVDNFGYQDFLLDNLSLVQAGMFGGERLTNGNLNTPGEPAGWTVTEGPEGEVSPGVTATADTVSFINFANHTPGGQQGLWVRPFVNTTQFDPDLPTVFATMSQVVPGTPNTDYTFSAWTAWEAGYSGGIAGSGSDNLLKMEFLDGSNAVIGAPLVLDLYAAGMRNDDTGNIEPEDWQQFSLPGTSPAGTASVRVSIEALDLFNTFIPEPMSAFYDDLSLIAVTPGLPGDYNGDGVVNTADYVKWRKDPAAHGGDPAGYNTWVQNFGEPSPGAGGGSGGVPEPTAFCLALIGLAALVGIRRQNRC